MPSASSPPRGSKQGPLAIDRRGRPIELPGPHVGERGRTRGADVQPHFRDQAVSAINVITATAAWCWTRTGEIRRLVQIGLPLPDERVDVRDWRLGVRGDDGEGHEDSDQDRKTFHDYSLLECKELSGACAIIREDPAHVSRLHRRAEDRQDRKRINTRAVHADSPVKMRAGDSSRRADLPNRVAARHGRALVHIDDREVREQ